MDYLHKAGLDRILDDLEKLPTGSEDTIEGFLAEYCFDPSSVHRQADLGQRKALLRWAVIRALALEPLSADPHQRQMWQYFNDPTFHNMVTFLRKSDIPLTKWQHALALATDFSAPQAVEPPGTPAGLETPRKMALGAEETGQELGADGDRWDMQD